MDWKSVAGLGVEVGVNVAVSRFAPGVGGSIVGGLAGGAAKSLTESTLKGQGIDVEDATKSALFGAGGSLAGHGAASGIGALSRVGAKRVGAELGQANKLVSDATKAGDELTKAKDGLTSAKKGLADARNDLAKINRALHPIDYKKALDSVKQAKTAVQQAGAKVGPARMKQVDADLLASRSRSSISGMQRRQKALDAAGKHLRGGKGKASKQDSFEAGGWGNTGLRALGGSIAAGRADGRNPAQSSPGNGKGGGKDKPGKTGPQLQQIEVAWGGAKYMKGEQKEPFAPDPNYKTSGSTTGFLLYPVGVNQQIRDWYVG
ncbi:hypothetical protein [Nocardia vermiculata]|uniref:Uncharacterized protein n=1 Tax=Nocardia vermiculata TaxID=257274 RepID=A0A846Y3D3_9NOCA|nr:hypothetical protein [Nocardia vermiculata]NKY54016.1 hypothetical protein [Nocardia vermiculata]